MKKKKHKITTRKTLNIHFLNITKYKVIKNYYYYYYKKEKNYFCGKYLVKRKENC